MIYYDKYEIIQTPIIYNNKKQPYQIGKVALVLIAQVAVKRCPHFYLLNQ